MLKVDRSKITIMSVNTSAVTRTVKVIDPYSFHANDIIAACCKAPKEPLVVEFLGDEFTVVDLTRIAKGATRITLRIKL